MGSKNEEALEIDDEDEIICIEYLQKKADSLMKWAN